MMHGHMNLKLGR